MYVTPCVTQILVLVLVLSLVVEVWRGKLLEGIFSLVVGHVSQNWQGPKSENILLCHKKTLRQFLLGLLGKEE